MAAFCAIWGKTGILWKDVVWKWSECSATPVPVISIGNPPGVDATTLIQPWMVAETPWNPYQTSSLDSKQKRLIKLVCKVKGQEYDEEKEVRDFKVTVGDIRMIVNAISDIDLQLKLEE